jgi:hypothetical protein
MRKNEWSHTSTHPCDFMVYTGFWKYNYIYISITYSECVSVFLVIFSAVYIAISGLSGSTIFSTLSYKRHDFRGGKIIEPNKICCDFPYIFSPNISNSKNNSARYYHKCISIGLHVKCRLLSYFNENWIFSTDIWEIKCQMKIIPVGTQFFHTDRRTESRAGRRRDTMKLNSRFSEFCHRT